MGHISDSVAASLYLTDSNPALMILICSLCRHVLYLMVVALLEEFQGCFERGKIKKRGKSEYFVLVPSLYMHAARREITIVLYAGSYRV